MLTGLNKAACKPDKGLQADFAWGIHLDGNTKLCMGQSLAIKTGVGHHAENTLKHASQI